MKERVIISVDSMPKLSRGFRLRFDKTRDQWVVLAPEKLFVPDPIALEIIKRCDGDTTVTAIVDDLAAAFKADRALVEKDVGALLQDLADKGVMTG